MQRYLLFIKFKTSVLNFVVVQHHTQTVVCFKFTHHLRKHYLNMFAKSYFNYFNQLKKWNPPPPPPPPPTCHWWYSWYSAFTYFTTCHASQHLKKKFKPYFMPVLTVESPEHRSPCTRLHFCTSPQNFWMFSAWLVWFGFLSFRFQLWSALDPLQELLWSIRLTTGWNP